MPPTELPPSVPDPVARVRQALCGSGRSELQSVMVVPTNEGVRLRGTVGTYYLKQMAQCVALETEGIMRVVNEMDVQ